MIWKIYFKNEKKIIDCKKIFSSTDLNKNDKITKQKLIMLRPRKGLYISNQILGKKLKKLLSGNLIKKIFKWLNFLKFCSAKNL